MYSFEIEKFIASKGRILTREEFIHCINNVDNPQVSDVKKLENSFMIKTEDGYNIPVSVKV